MKIRVPIAGLMLLVFSSPAWAREVAYEYRGCGTAEWTVLDRAGETSIVHGVLRGIADDVAPGGPLGKTTYECRSVAHASKDGFEFTSRCVFVDGDGHKFVGMSTGTPKSWQWKFLAGTGKWEGISGGGVSETETAYPRLSPAVGGSCWRAKGTYVLKR